MSEQYTRQLAARVNLTWIAQAQAAYAHACGTAAEAAAADAEVTKLTAAAAAKPQPQPQPSIMVCHDHQMQYDRLMRPFVANPNWQRDAAELEGQYSADRCSQLAGWPATLGSPDQVPSKPAFPPTNP